MPARYVDWTPIRKFVVAFVAAGLWLVVRAAGVDLGPDLVNDAATAVVALAAFYIAKDPRVLGSSGGPPAP